MYFQQLLQKCFNHRARSNRECRWLGFSLWHRVIVPLSALALALIGDERGLRGNHELTLAVSSGANKKLTERYSLSASDGVGSSQTPKARRRLSKRWRSLRNGY